MDGRARVCWIFIGILVVMLLAVGYIWKKKLVFREVLIGTLLYVVGKMALYQAVYSFVVQGIGIQFSEMQKAAIAALIDAVVLVAGYFIVFKLFYSINNSSTNAISVAFGEMISEVVVSIGYSLLSYGLILQAIHAGNAESIFQKQGLEDDMVATMIDYFSQITTSDLVLILIRGISVIFIQIIVALLVYYGQKQKKYIFFAYALLVVLAFNLNNQVIAAIAGKAAMALFAVGVIVYLWYAEFKDNSIVEMARKE